MELMAQAGIGPFNYTNYTDYTPYTDYTIA